MKITNITVEKQTDNFFIASASVSLLEVLHAELNDCMSAYKEAIVEIAEAVLNQMGWNGKPALVDYKDIDAFITGYGFGLVGKILTLKLEFRMKP